MQLPARQTPAMVGGVQLSVVKGLSSVCTIPVAEEYCKFLQSFMFNGLLAAEATGENHKTSKNKEAGIRELPGSSGSV
jgi:hypothetical protein